MAGSNTKMNGDNLDTKTSNDVCNLLSILVLSYLKLNNKRTFRYILLIVTQNLVSTFNQREDWLCLSGLRWHYFVVTMISISSSACSILLMSPINLPGVFLLPNDPWHGSWWHNLDWDRAKVELLSIVYLWRYLMSTWSENSLWIALGTLECFIRSIHLCMIGAVSLPVARVFSAASRNEEYNFFWCGVN